MVFRLLLNESGQGTAEYAIIYVTVVIIAVFIILAFADPLRVVYQNIETRLEDYQKEIYD